MQRTESWLPGLRFTDILFVEDAESMKNKQMWTQTCYAKTLLKAVSWLSLQKHSHLPQDKLMTLAK